MHDKVAAEHARLGSAPWLCVKPQTDHRVAESVREEEFVSGETFLDN